MHCSSARAKTTMWLSRENLQSNTVNPEALWCMRPALFFKDRDVREYFRGIYIMHTIPTLLCRDEYSPSCNTSHEVEKVIFLKHCRVTSSISPGRTGVYGVSEKDLRYPMEWEKL